MLSNFDVFWSMPSILSRHIGIHSCKGWMRFDLMNTSSSDRTGSFRSCANRICMRRLHDIKPLYMYSHLSPCSFFFTFLRTLIFSPHQKAAILQRRHTNCSRKLPQRPWSWRSYWSWSRKLLHWWVPGVQNLRRNQVIQVDYVGIVNCIGKISLTWIDEFVVFFWVGSLTSSISSQ